MNFENEMYAFIFRQINEKSFSRIIYKLYFKPKFWKFKLKAIKWLIWDYIINFFKHNYDSINSKVNRRNKSTLTNLSTNFVVLILPRENFSSLLLHLICISINKARKVLCLHLNATSAKTITPDLSMKWWTQERICIMHLRA